MMLVNDYISLFKENKIEENTKHYKIKNYIQEFINNFIEDNGYIFITNDLILNFINLLKFVLKELSYNINDTLFNIQYFNYFLNQKVMYNQFFEKIGLDLSNLVIKNIDFEIISKVVYEIYIYGTTINNLQTYLTFNKDLVYPNQEHIKLLNTYISKKSIFDLDFTCTSYKLLKLGHLLSYDFTYEKVNNPNQKPINLIIENTLITYARITLECIKNLNFKNLQVNENEFIIEIFEDLINQFYNLSTPVFYNSLKKYNLLTSCYILSMDDSIDSISSCCQKLMKIQKHNSGTGVVVNKVRAKGRPVMNNITKSKGVLTYFDIIATYCEQFKNVERSRSSNTNVTITIEHPDLIDLLNKTLPNSRNNDFDYNNIFTTISISDEFFYRLLTNKKWYFISPEQTINDKHLYNVVGEEYSQVFNEMINNPLIEKKEMKSEDVSKAIIQSLQKTGNPFFKFKDVVNYTSNQKYHGVIQGTNLCTEIFEYSDDNETSCCNLISINLKKYVFNKKFDFDLLKKKIFNIVIILNNIIDQGYYSEETCKTSNLKNRPMGIGIQGFTNMLYEMNISFLHGKELLRKITEIMYFSACFQSNYLAKIKAFSLYDPIIKSPLHNKVFSNMLYKEYQKKKKEKLEELNLTSFSDLIKLSDYDSKYISENDWNSLAESIQKYGVVNSLFLAFMPTSLSAGIFNNVEGFEPFTDNIYKHMYSQHDIIIYNKYLVNDLLEAGIFTKDNVISNLLKIKGKINLLNISTSIKNHLLQKYQTIYEIDEPTYVAYNTYINCFIDQGKSTNLYIKNNDTDKLIQTILLHWIYGSKSTYYFRSHNTSLDLNFNKECSMECNSCSS